MRGKLLPVLLIAFISFTSEIAQAQSWLPLTGKLIDSATLKPLPGARIEIANTTLGTTTNTDGVYTLPTALQPPFKVIFSYLGYKPRLITIDNNVASLPVVIALSQQPIQLSEVAIRSGDQAKWLGIFKKEFIGANSETEYAILNPQVIHFSFSATKNKLTASTNVFLEIINNLLGYKLRFLINNFTVDYKAGTCHYEGTVLFSELEGKSKQLKQWSRNREQAYYGSFKHFLITLIKAKLSDTLEQSKNLVKSPFVLKRLIVTTNVSRPTDSIISEKTSYYLNEISKHGSKSARDSMALWYKRSKAVKFIQKLDDSVEIGSKYIAKTLQPSIFRMQFSGCLYIIYKGKKVTMDTDDLFRFKEARNYQIAAITLKNNLQPILFDDSGILLTKDNLSYQGAWSNRIISLLPDNYLPARQ